MSETPTGSVAGRRIAVMAIFGCVVAGLVWRAVDLQLTHKDFLQDHGDARYLRTVAVPAHRGMITDRRGEPLAVSTPVSSVWANPRKLLVESSARLPSLAALLGMSPDHLKALLQSRIGREFVYLKRQVEPDLAERIMALGVPGVALAKEFRRYYPASEVTAHLVGFTNVDDVGQEGVELAFDSVLHSESGAKRVIKDRLGRVVEDVESIRAPRPGHDLALSIDKRIQYLAYRELKAAVLANHARGGSIVILDVRTGEVIAMVNQPSYNPNNRNALKTDTFRNRAVTDLFEPGSTIKPFTIATALESGSYEPTTKIDTAPGYFSIGHHVVKDIKNYGLIDVANVITKSSNVGASKIALSLDPELIWRLFQRVGFGAMTSSGFPGEASGHLSDYREWREIEQATLAFGYGISVTALQLAHAYLAVAADGIMPPLSLARIDAPAPGERVMSARTAQQVRTMLESVVQSGTGQLARVPGYRVAGKTGTVHKTATGGYAEDRYLALFAGLLPASRPRLVAVVVIDDPRAGEYFGGRVAAPVFAKVMADAVRLMDVPPDDLEGLREQTMVYASASPEEDTGWTPRQ